jgi:hypothetical protein
MMTGEVLTLIMIVAGTTAGTITITMKRKYSMTTGLSDTMGMVGGIEGRCRAVIVHRPCKMKGMGWVTDPLNG